MLFIIVDFAVIHHYHLVILLVSLVVIVLLLLLVIFIGVVSVYAEFVFGKKLCRGVDRPQFYIFQEHYHNSNHYWWQSLPGHVLPGDIVVGKVSLVQGGYNLTLFSNITGQSTLNFVPKLSTTAFSELYLVMEHYPLACDELPQSNVIFTDINIDVNRETVHLSADSWNITNPVDHICDIRLSTDATGKRFVFQW